MSGPHGAPMSHLRLRIAGGATGLLSGLAGGLSGIGGAIVSVPLLTRLARLTPQQGAPS